MNITKLLLAGIFALVTSVSYAADEKKLTCCEKAKADGKDCAHKCCVEAKGKGEICKKCNPPKDK